MAVGDVIVTAVQNPTATSLDDALTAIRTTAGANGHYGMVNCNNVIFVWGIVEA